METSYIAPAWYLDGPQPQFDTMCRMRYLLGMANRPTVNEVFTLHKEEIREQIEEGWQSARRGEFADGDEVFDRIDAELEAVERSAPK
jgi:predicted transcriptional regulator